MKESYFYNLQCGTRISNEHYSAGKELYKNKDYERALHHFWRASVDNIWAKLYIGACYSRGKGVNRNPLIAYHLLKKFTNKSSFSEFAVNEVKRLDEELQRMSDSEKSALKHDVIYDSEFGKIEVIYTNIENPSVTFGMDGIKVRLRLAEYYSVFYYIYKRLNLNDFERGSDSLGRIDENFTREYPLLKLAVSKEDVDKAYVRNKGSLYTLVVPLNTNFSLAYVRESCIELFKKKALYTHASKYLPLRLEQISKEVGVEYKSCKINSNRSFIGKFSQNNKLVEFSYHLIKSTPEYIDSVIIHELTHSFVLGHGNDFYQKMEELSSEHIVMVDKKYIGYSNIYDI